MDAGSAILWIIFVILLVILIYLIIKVIRLVRGRRRALEDKYGYLPSHTELYFEEYFPKIISEWDLVTKPKLEHWKKGVQVKLKSVSGEINDIMDYKKSIDSRIEKLEKEVYKLEKK